MQDISVEKDSTIAYRIEPFYYEKAFSTIESLVGFRPFLFTKEMFYDYIDKLMFVKKSDPSYENQIAKSYQIDWNKQKSILYSCTYQKKELSIPPQKTKYEYLVKEFKDKDANQVKRYICFTIENIQLIVSEMQVGFLVYDLKVVELFDKIDGIKRPLSQTIDNHEEAMYYLRKLQNANEGYLKAYVEDFEANENRREYFMRKREAEENELPFNEEQPSASQLISIPIKWTDITAGFLEKLGKTHGFNNDQKVGHHTLMYTSSFLETPSDRAETGEAAKEFNQLVASKAFNIGHGYRQTYHKATKIEDVVRPFENVMWSFSAEGAANLVYYPADERAKAFFDNTFKSKRKTNYYYMYLLALFQKYSLLYFTIRAANLLYQSSVYNGEVLSKEDRDEELSRTRRFHAEMLKFTIHGYYEQVSYHTHYNDMYEQLIKILRIPELQHELSPKTEAFRQVIESLVYEQNNYEKELTDKEERKRYEQEQRDKKVAEEEKREQREQERKSQEKQQNIIQTVTYFLLPATLATGILGMNIPLITNSTDFFLAYAVFGVILITSLLSIWINKKINWIPAKITMIGAALLLLLFAGLDVFSKPSTPVTEPGAQLEIEEGINEVEPETMNTIEVE